MVVAQLGARMHYAVPRIYHQAGMLSRLFTDITAVQGWPRYLSSVPEACRPAALKRLLDRVPRGVPTERIVSFPWFGFVRSLWGLWAMNRSQRTRGYLWAGRRLGNLIAGEGWEEASGVYAFQTAAREVFRHAGRQGATRFLEMPNVPREILDRLIAEEANRHPSWSGRPPDDRFLEDQIEREHREWELADVILCPSDFVLESVDAAGGPVEKCRVVPYGVDWERTPRETSPPNQPVNVLTVGTVSLRKGTPYVLEAARRCGDRFRFRMVGPCKISSEARLRLEKHVDLTGVVPRSEVTRHYQWADVFLLPSICEGSATVTYEALAFGLPVICTRNTGSIIRDGEEGCVVPIRDPEAIVDALVRLAEDDDRYVSFCRKARERFERAGSMEAYADRLLDVTRQGHADAGGSRGGSSPSRGTGSSGGFEGS